MAVDTKRTRPGPNYLIVVVALLSATLLLLADRYLGEHPPTERPARTASWPATRTRATTAANPTVLWVPR